MFVVALTDLRGQPFEPAAGALATALGSTAYEVKLTVTAGLPAVLLATVDEPRARAAELAMKKAGFGAVTLDRRSTVPSGRMTALRDFRFDPGGLVPAAGSAELLPYEAIRALIKATHRSVAQTTAEVKSKSFDPVRAIATGGVLMSKTTTKQVVSRTEERQQVVYLFRDGGDPWILRERDARYQALGALLSPTSVSNLATTLRLLRERSPRARCDERLVAPRPVRGVADGVEATDLLAYLIAAAG